MPSSIGLMEQYHPSPYPHTHNPPTCTHSRRVIGDIPHEQRHALRPPPAPVAPTAAAAPPPTPTAAAPAAAPVVLGHRCKRVGGVVMVDTRQSPRSSHPTIHIYLHARTGAGCRSHHGPATGCATGCGCESGCGSCGDGHRSISGWAGSIVRACLPFAIPSSSVSSHRLRAPPPAINHAPSHRS